MAQKKTGRAKRAQYAAKVESSADALSRSMSALANSYNRSFNKDNPMTAAKASDLAEMEMIQPVPTSHITFDLMTGIGGLPRGKIIEFTGEEGSHKSNMAWECVGAVHQADPYAYCVWIDAEKAIDVRVPAQRRHILNMHVDLNRLFICVPDTAEQAWRMISMACQNNATLVVLDSISALIPKKEYDDVDSEKSGYPALPAAINKGFRQLSTELFMTGTTLIEINQVRENLDVAGQKYVRFEDRWKSTGGKGLKHWLTLRVMFRKKKIWQPDGDSKRHIGDEVIAWVIKTRLAPVKDQARMFMYHATGFDRYEELLQAAEDWGVLYKEKQTSRNWFWFGFEDELGAVSENEWRDLIKSDPEYYELLATDVRDTYNAHFDEDAAVSEEADELADDYEDEEDEE